MFSLSRFEAALAALAAMSAFEGTSAGAITYISQQRQISVQGFVNNVSQGQLITAPDFNMFNRSITRPLTENAGSMFASQNSLLLVDRITADCRSSVTVTSVSVNEAFAGSTLAVSFMLTAPSDYFIQQTHTSLGSTGTRPARAQLVGPDGVVFEWREDRNQPSTWPSGDVSGTLSAGTYSLMLEASVFTSSIGGFGTLSSGISFAMTIPAPTGAAIGLGSLGIFFLSRRRRTQSQVG